MDAVYTAVAGSACRCVIEEGCDCEDRSFDVGNTRWSFSAKMMLTYSGHAKFLSKRHQPYKTWKSTHLKFTILQCSMIHPITYIFLFKQMETGSFFLKFFSTSARVRGGRERANSIVEIVFFLSKVNSICHVLRALLLSAT